MLKAIRTRRKKSRQSGQNAVEYMLVLCIVIISLLAVAGPGGPFFRSLNYTLFTSGNVIEQMAHNIYYNVYSETGTLTVEP
ncbi:MAG: hypothetical protein KKD07_06960 [Candidatus Omnitrophica bacterium]|nr:hypothetical protein [Candidatus Omnitrophota bacterium]MBU1997576.1 hypothetical protein [Candidatus Omnitrophota bacterium]MBU4334164.1 hypothetical protein [Candidatus Omnitrophota bacterium]